MKITKRFILTLRPAILNDQSPRHCVKMKCFIVAQLKRNLVKVLIKVCPTESGGVLKISQSATKLWQKKSTKLCLLPTICTLFAIAFTSRPSTSIKHLQFYTLTLVFLNSSLNPVIYCWKMKHIRHTIIGFIRNAFTKQN